MIKFALVTFLLLMIGGCAAHVPVVYVGMTPDQAHKACISAWPPAWPEALRMMPDGTFRRLYMQDSSGHRTYIRMDDKNGRVTDVQYSSY